MRTPTFFAALTLAAAALTTGCCCHKQTCCAPPVTRAPCCPPAGAPAAPTGAIPGPVQTYSSPVLYPSYPPASTGAH